MNRTTAYYVGATIDTTHLFNGEGLVGIWTGQVTREIKASVQAKTPVNKGVNKTERNAMWPVGSLKRSIRGRSTRAGTHTRDMVISANTPYAIYVHRGTRGPIYPTHSPYLVLPRNTFYTNPKEGKMTYTHATPIQKRDFVKGQRPQRFIIDGYWAIAQRHPALPNLSGSTPLT